MRDLIDNWWILINLSFLSSGATQWSRGETHYLPRIGRPAKNKPRAAGNGNCPLSKSTVILSPIPNQVWQSGQGVTCSGILKYASLGVGIVQLLVEF